MAIPHTADRAASSVHMDLARGLAAIVVMLGHSRDLFFSSLSGHNPIPALTHGVIGASHPQITWGNEAVMIFFVLSGYLVGGSVLRARSNSKWSWKEYLTMRLTRLWVVLIPALVLTVAVDLAGLKLFPQTTSIYHGPLAQAEVPQNLTKRLTPAVIVGNGAFLQNILVPPAGTNIALWSLSNEFWYYLTFPLLVFAYLPTHRFLKRTLAAFGAAAILILIGLNGAVLFLPWLLGALISVLPRRLTDRSSSLLLSCFSVCIVPFMLLVRRCPIDLRLAQMCIALYFGAMLYVIANRSKINTSKIYDAIASLASNLSYPLYLVHLPVLVFLCASVNRPWHQWARSPIHFAAVLGMDLVAMLVAYLFHLAFQRHTSRVRQAASIFFACKQGKFCGQDTQSQVASLPS